jgi:hypothetical protein
MSKAQCVYCLVTKDLSEFNREHVLPEAFGKYEGNLVLNKRVCVACNDYFSKHLDAPLARDSKEGIDRFQHGLVREKKPRRLGRRLTLRQRGGRLDGSLIDLELDASGTALVPKPARQLGFGASEAGPFDWHRVEDLPDPAALGAKGFCYVVTGGLDAEEATSILEKLGLPTTDRVEVPDPRDADGMLDTSMHGRIDKIIRRAVAKIAFNYLVHCYPALAAMEQFRTVREYIRFDLLTAQDPVTILTKPILGSTPPGTEVLVHVVAVRWDKARHRVIAQVSLFGWLQYEVTLTRDRFIIPPLFVDSGHAFNPFASQIAQLTRDRRRAMPMPLVRKADIATLRRPNATRGATPARS